MGVRSVTLENPDKYKVSRCSSAIWHQAGMLLGSLQSQLRSFSLGQSSVQAAEDSHSGSTVKNELTVQSNEISEKIVMPDL
jgi:hypothetical protein